MSPFLVLKLFWFVQAIQNWFKLLPFSHTDLAWNKPPEGLQNVSRFRSSSSFGTGCFSLELAEHTFRRFLSSLHRLPNWKGHLSPPVLVSFPESLYTRPNLETLWLHPQNCGDEGARQVIAFFQMPAISKGRLCSAGTWVAPPSTSGSSSHSFFCIKDLPTLSIKLSPIPSLLLVCYELILARNNIGCKNESKFCLATASNPQSEHKCRCKIFRRQLSLLLSWIWTCPSPRICHGQVLPAQQWPQSSNSKVLEGLPTTCDVQMVAAKYILKLLFFHSPKEMKFQVKFIN